MRSGVSSPSSPTRAPPRGFSWQELSNEQLADVLTYTATAWNSAGGLPEDFGAFTPDEIEAQRGQDWSAQQVYERRQGLELGGE